MSSKLGPIPAGIDSENAITPEGWTVLRIGEMFSRRVEPGRLGLQVMSIVMDRGLVERESVERRVETNLPPTGHLLVRSGDIAYNMMRMWQGVLGRGEFDCMVSPAYIVLQPNGKVDPGFAEQLFSTEAAIAKFKHLSYGVVADRLRLYYRDLVRIPFAVPKHRDEQEDLAEILSVVDETIDRTEALVAKHQHIKIGLMHDLFTRGIADDGQLRPLPSEAPELFADSQLGFLPVGWTCCTIETLLANTFSAMRSGPFGSSLLKDELVENGIPLLGIDNILPERFVPTFKRYVSTWKFAQLRRYAVRPGDVIITIMGTVGHCCVVPSYLEDALSSKHLWTMTFDTPEGTAGVGLLAA